MERNHHHVPAPRVCPSVFAAQLDHAELCAEFLISEKTGYKWMARFAAEGDAGLADRSHAPRSIPHRMPDALAEFLLTVRRAHPTWGPRKLVAYCAARQTDVRWPAPSSVGALLKRMGYVRERRARARAAAMTHWGLTPAGHANAVWTADFKGQFRIHSGAYCFPLTVADAYSRFLLACRALRSTEARTARSVFHTLFQEYGLPEVIRTDNGVPFATPRALGQLSALAIWWIRLGIRPERIEPGQPQQNGRHERMHRTLKAETTRPTASSWHQQQQRFDWFRDVFNTQRPHEALGQLTPASYYTGSPRPYPARLPALEYAAGIDVRRVNAMGQFAWHTHRVFLSQCLIGQDIGIEPGDDRRWRVRFGSLILGHFDLETKTFKPHVCWSPSPINPS